MAWIEDITRRDATHKHFYNSDNPRQWQVVNTIHHQHYHDGTAWQDEDESIVNGTETGFVHKCDKTRHAIHIGATGTRRWLPRRDHPAEYIEFGRLQSWSGTAWANVNLGTPVRVGNRIAWVATAFDLSLTNTWRHIKIEAKLKTEAARRRLRWAVSLSGLTYNAGDLTSIADGTVVGHVDKPIAWDANGSIENQNVAIVTTYGGGYLEFGGDLSAAVLPITIDPTLTAQPDAAAGVDTYLDNANATSNFATNVVLSTYNNITPSHYYANILLLFDVSSIPDDSTIDSATLTLTIAGNHSNCTMNIQQILSANSGWTEAGATWNHSVGTTDWAGDTAGDHGTDAGCSVDGTDASATVDGTIIHNAEANNTALDGSLTTSRVKSLLTTNYGWRIRTVTDATTVNFHSSDATTAGYRPKLVVTYTEAAAGNPWFAYAQMRRG